MPGRDYDPCWTDKKNEAHIGCGWRESQLEDGRREIPRLSFHSPPCARRGSEWKALESTVTTKAGQRPMVNHLKIKEISKKNTQSVSH